MAIPSKTVAVGGVTQVSQYDTLYNNAILANTGGTAGGSQSIPGEKTFQSATVFQATATFSGTVDIQGTATIPDIAGPVAIGGQLEITGASRVIASTNTAQAIPTTSFTIFKYEDEEEDNLLEYNISTGIFTAKKAGTYIVSASCRLASVAWTAGQVGIVSLFKNASEYARLDYHQVEANKTMYLFVGGSTMVTLAVGDTLDVRLYQTRGVDTNTNTIASANRLSIHRLS